MTARGKLSPDGPYLPADGGPLRRLGAQAPVRSPLVYFSPEPLAAPWIATRPQDWAEPARRILLERGAWRSYRA
jgi:hypothetical protein